MTGMAHAPGPSHARKAAASRPHDRIAAWLVLAFAGTTMVSFNMWHAIHGGIVFMLAILYGLAPVVLAMGLSHMVAAYRGGWFMKGVTFAIMLGAMVLSIRATGYVVKPASGNLWPLFGIVTDSAALLALQVILSPESRAAAKAARKAAGEATADAVGEPVEAIEEPVIEATPEAVAVASWGSPEEPREVPLGVPASVPEEKPAEKPTKNPRPRAVRISEDPEAKRARAEYRKSVNQEQPLSDRALAAKFGRSRTWGASRIAEVEEGPALTAQAR
jgi:hypothetical protein